MGWLDVIWVGLVAGLAMGMWSMAMRWVGFSRMDVPRYLGCLVTGEPAGTGTFLTGMMVHLVLSLVVAYVYAFFFEVMWGYGSILSAVMLGGTIGVVHWLVGGLLLAAIDAVHRCVERGEVPAMGRFGIGYGGGAVFTFLVGHVLFGAVFGWIYALLEGGTPVEF